MAPAKMPNFDIDKLKDIEFQAMQALYRGFNHTIKLLMKPSEMPDRACSVCGIHHMAGGAKYKVYVVMEKMK